MQRSHWNLLVAAGILVGALGCSAPAPSDTSTTPKPGSETAKKDIKITLIAKSSTNPVFLYARDGAEAAAKELGEKNGVKITIDWQTPPTEDGQVQAQKIAQAVNEGSNAIIISCSDAAKVTGAINDAADKGVPVMTFDSDAPDSKRFAFYGTDDAACGAQVLNEVLTLVPPSLNRPYNVAILAGNQNAPNLQKRVKGVKDEAAKHPNIKIVDVFYHPETPQDAAAAVLQAMKTRPEIDAWAMVGGWPLFTKTLLTDLDPNKVKVVAVDALPLQLPYVEKGIAPVLLAQPTYKWGYISVEKVVDKVLLNKPVETINKMDLVRVTKDNLGDWAKQLQEWGFTDIDPKYLEMAKK